jgi:3' terminal RNA ribose 2'-O-methyltransferase Hen1
MSFGSATVYYGRASDEECVATLALEIDPVALVRGRGRDGGRWDQYVNDRPYVASSYLSSAISKMFGTAMTGRSKERQELADSPLPLSVELPVVMSRPGGQFIHDLFEPLGYLVSTTRIPLDPSFPEWGESPYYAVRVSGTVPLKDLLEHLYVLIPVLDDSKHYYVDKDEIEKLLRRGSKWLADHPARTRITARYLQHKHSLTREALARLSEQDGELDPDQHEEDRLERLEEAKALPLHTQRLESVLQILVESRASSVLDLGCGEGRLLSMLIKEKQFSRIVGMDVSYRAVERAARKLRLERMPPMVRDRIELIHGSLVYRDKRLEGFDAAAIVEVIEHLDAHRLESFARCVFEFARPHLVVLTTPNREFNAMFEGMESDQLRHGDHRFEWTRAEFQDWGESVAKRFGYEFQRSDIGPAHEGLGAPSQLGVFRR